MFYGVVKPSQVREYVVAVCDVLGHGSSNMAVPMLLETCAQETHMGRLRDRHPVTHGVGLFQCDPIGHKEVLRRAVETEQGRADRGKILEAWHFDVLLVEYHQLAFTPLFAAVFCRLFYKGKTPPFPIARLGRAQYWKEHYNTDAGRGSVEEYMRNADRWVI